MKNQLKILAIDDNTDFVEGIKRLFVKDNLLVEGAGSGEEGLALMKTFQPDLVLLDLVLPGISGFEVCSRIKQDPSLKNTLVVMLSSVKTQTDDQSSGLEQGADGFIARPLPNRELYARIKAYLRIKENEARYRMLYNTMIMGYALHEIIVDERGKGIDYRYLEVNPEFENLTGTRARDILGKTAREVFPETEDYWIERYAEVAMKGTETRFTNYSGQLKRYFEVFAFSPAPGQFSTLFYDVTQRVMAEDRLKQYNKELQMLNQDKDIFFSIVAHDLRSPFNPILGMSEFLAENNANLPPEQLKKYCQSINNSAKNVFAILENLLQWGRMQLDKELPEKESLPVRETVDEVIHLFRDIAPLKKVSLMNAIDPRCSVMANKSMFQSVIRNLLSNAIKFSWENGRVDISSSSDGEYCRIQVEDHGVGMAADMINRLMTSNRLHSTSGTRGEKGTGLGLVITLELLKKNGGKLDIESKEGAGTRVSISLPQQH